ncbi:MAG: hypothetical protein HY928_08240 [Elusimicrobia bacterium]|nr:hypothetical protein [Elusimicrobiota bacterium]
MLIAGLMALHTGAFAGWLAAATADAFLAEAGARAEAGRLARLWAPFFMSLCLASGAVAMVLSYPFYRAQTWVWAKAALSLAPVVVTLLRAADFLRPRAALWALALPLTAALALSFLRPF